MAYKGGVFSTIPDTSPLPGARINVVSKERATSVLSPRGIVAVPMVLDWGVEDEVASFVAKDYTRDALYNFGYDVGHEALINIDELFKGATEALIVRLNAGGEKAKCDLCESRWSGIRGNDFTITIEADPDAGMTTREYADTSATFEAENDQITVTYKNVPNGYAVAPVVTMGDEEIKDYSVSVDGDVATITFDKSLQSGDYKVLANIAKNGSTKLIATARIDIVHEDETIATVQVVKDTETKNSSVGPELSGVNVTFSEKDNAITAKFSEVPEGYSLAAQLKMGAVIVAKQAGRIEEEISKDSITFKFFKEAPMKAAYTFVARLQKNDDKSYTTISSQTFNLQLKGEDRSEQVSATIESTSKEDFSGEIPARFIVKTFLDSIEVDKQKPRNIDWLKDNDFVVWNRSIELEPTAGTPLTGGTNGDVTMASWAEALNKLEPYNFHILACPCDDEDVKNMYIEFTRKMRDEMGVKFQTVTPKTAENPNYEGIIQIENEADGRDVDDVVTALIYWVAGQQAGCKLNESVANTEYNGKFNVNLNYTQRDLENTIENGYLAFHMARGVDRQQHCKVLLDINTLTEIGENKNESWKRNQTIRVCDQAANDIAAIFNNNYFGKVPNKISGREQLKNDIIKYLYQLETIGAIDGFDETSVIVEEGPNRVTVIVEAAITPVNAMEQMYMRIYVE